MASVVPKQTAETRFLTVEEFVDAYTRQPVEVVDGKIVEMAPAEVAHMLMAHFLYDALAAWAREGGLGRAFIETPYVLDGSRRKNWVQGARVPDVSFLAQDRLKAHLDQHGASGPFWLAPDLAVEIVSVNDRYVDVQRKVVDYLRYGVRLVWVINPEMRVIRVFSPDDPEGRTLHEADTLTGDPVLPGWSIPVASVLDSSAG